MKYRIIKFCTNKYGIQRKNGLCGAWHSICTASEDYPDYLNIKNYSEWELSSQYKDMRKDVFSEVELAVEKVKKLIAKDEEERLSKIFTTVQEFEA